jgi:hypothetical protein
MGPLTRTVVSLSVHVGGVDNPPNNRFQVAIYTNSNGAPASLVAKSGTGTLRANSWNTLPLSATLQAGRTYWLVYNTNGTNDLNNLHFIPTGTNRSVWTAKGQVFGIWPTSFGPATKWNAIFSIYATLNP